MKYRKRPVVIEAVQRPGRAQARARAMLEKPERVRRILDKMLDGTWKGGEAQRTALAAEWGCSPATLRHDAQEAHVALGAMGAADLAAARGRALAEIQRVKRMAATRKRTGMPDPDVKTYLQAVDLESQITGAKVTRTSSTVTTVDASALTSRERVAQLKDLIQSAQDELAAEEARMAAEERGGELQ